jgi:multicomponent Na+:H+ antiporter subunit D
MLVGIGALGAITLTIGFQPQAFISYAQAAASSLLDPAAYIGSVFAPAGGGR